MIEKLKKYSFLLSLLVLIALFSSLFVNWISINLLGNYSFASLEIIKSGVNNNGEKYNLFNLFSQYNNSYFSLIFSMIFYVTSILTISLSLFLKNYRLKFLLIAGILAVLSGALWIYSIESFKINFVETAASAGGIIGEEWKGQEKNIINAIINIGFGHYTVILSGAFSILIYLWLK